MKLSPAESKVHLFINSQIIRVVWFSCALCFRIDNISPQFNYLRMVQSIWNKLNISDSYMKYYIMRKGYL